jgi:hypothetical protein
LGSSRGFGAVYADENVWLSQKMMAQLYDVDVRTINYHLKKIFSDSELQEDSVIRAFRITATAAEVIYGRADAAKEHMGLHIWADAPMGKIQKFDVVVAKNYLTEHELAQLNSK